MESDEGQTSDEGQPLGQQYDELRREKARESTGSKTKDASTFTFIIKILDVLYSRVVLGSETMAEVEATVEKEDVIEFFGIVVVRRSVVVPKDKKAQYEYLKSRENGNEISRQALKILLLSYMILVPAYLLYKYQPQIVDQSCPGRMQLAEVQRNLEQCQSNLTTTSDNLSGCSEKSREHDNAVQISSDETAKASAELKEAKSKISSVENSLTEARGSIASLEKRENDLQINISSLTEEKENLHKKVDETEVFVGKCRNKNMDHEIEKSELLRKLQKAEKELKNCH